MARIGEKYIGGRNGRGSGRGRDLNDRCDGRVGRKERGMTREEEERE